MSLAPTKLSKYRVRREFPWLVRYQCPGYRPQTLSRHRTRRGAVAALKARRAAAYLRPERYEVANSSTLKGW